MLTHEELAKHQKELKFKVVRQFLNLLFYFQDWKNEVSSVLVWGDEIEAHMVQLDPPRLYCPDQLPPCDVELMAEYGRWMIETIPKTPYLAVDLICDVLRSMKERYKSFRKLPCHVISIPAMPFMGAEPRKARGPVANSQFIDD